MNIIKWKWRWRVMSPRPTNLSQRISTGLVRFLLEQKFFGQSFCHCSSGWSILIILLSQAKGYLSRSMTPTLINESRPGRRCFKLLPKQVVQINWHLCFASSHPLLERRTRSCALACCSWQWLPSKLASPFNRRLASFLFQSRVSWFSPVYPPFWLFLPSRIQVLTSRH